jgi:hypothetical protein
VKASLKENIPLFLCFLKALLINCIDYDLENLKCSPPSVNNSRSTAYIKAVINDSIAPIITP